ncbi:hypothetical protein [Desulfobacter curvatus]|nr:hypothetical protein [Desulfobacter curvatus]
MLKKKYQKFRYYKKNSRAGQRFSTLLGENDIPREILQAVFPQ